MIVQIDIFNFKVLRCLRVPLCEYQLLVGPNGSGKSSVFDAVLFVRNSLLGKGPEEALRMSKAESLLELTHQAKGGPIGFSFVLKHEEWPILRYTVVFGQDSVEGLIIESEAVTRQIRRGTWDIPGAPAKAPINFDLFHDADMVSQIDLLQRHAGKKTENWERILYKTSKGADLFTRLGLEGEGRIPYHLQTKIAGRKQLSLKFVPDENGYEYSSWIKEYLLNAPTRIQLDIESIKVSGSPEKSSEQLSENGDNFANVVYRFKENDRKGFDRWVRHLREFFPEILDIDPQVRPENQRRLIWVVSAAGIRVPQYLLSDGTLRFMALTLLAFHHKGHKFLLIEEPENGLHPSAIEGIIRPFKTAYPEMQVIFASHSPVVLANFKLRDVLVFRKTELGTAIVAGSDHPALQDWAEDLDKANLLAEGIF